MWPFGKKKEKAQPQNDARAMEEAQVQAFAQKFLPEEFTILAVTDPTGFGGSKVEDGPLLVGGATLTAWMREDGEEINREERALLTLVDDNLMKYLRAHLPGNFIIKAKVRPAQNGTAFQLIGMPEPGFDPDLKAFLEEQKKPVTLDGQEFGTFTLVRSLGWFDGEAQWCSQPVRLNFEQTQDSQRCLDTARTLFAQEENWNQQIVDLAVEQLLEPLNELAQEAEEDPMSREELAEQLIPDSIQVTQDGGFTFWYGDGGVFWGRGIQVFGTISGGVSNAILEE